MPSKCADRKGETRVRWAPRPDGLEESVQFTPGYNCTDDSMQGHGVHGMEICWLLRGPLGAVQLIIGSDWIPGELRPGHGLSPDGQRAHRLVRGGWDVDPHGRGIGVHSRRPQYEDHEAERCGLLDGSCYYAESLLASDEPVARFIAEGEQVIWDELERRYAELASEAEEARRAANG
jgi:hypothetical protein